MLLCKRWNGLNVRTQAIIGSLASVGAVILRFLARPQCGLSDFWQGFLIGLALVMMGSSIVINTRVVVHTYIERRR